MRIILLTGGISFVLLSLVTLAFEVAYLPVHDIPADDISENAS